jgi:hypothetical protein
MKAIVVNWDTVLEDVQAVESVRIDFAERGLLCESQVRDLISDSHSRGVGLIFGQVPAHVIEDLPEYVLSAPFWHADVGFLVFSPQEESVRIIVTQYTDKDSAMVAADLVTAVVTVVAPHVQVRRNGITVEVFIRQIEDLRVDHIEMV